MTLFGASQPYKRVSSPLLKFTWLLFTFSSHFLLLVAIFWWIFVFERGVTPIDWLNLVPHGVVPITVTFDGLNVNRIPLRWQHYIGFVIPMELIYVFWTYCQNELAEIDNPMLPVNSTDDAIYEDYNWKEDGSQPLVLSVIGIFVIGPFIFFVEWMFSQYWVMCLCLGDRRLYYEDPRINKPKRRNFEGAGLANGLQSYDLDDDVSASSNNISIDEEEEKVEDEPSEDFNKPKKTYRSKLEELANYKK